MTGLGGRERFGVGVANGQREPKEVVLTAIIPSCYFRGSLKVEISYARKKLEANQ